MGYQVYIERQDEQLDAQINIQFEEIQKLVAGELDLSIDNSGVRSATNPLTGKLITINSNTMTINWFGFGGDKEGTPEAKFTFEDGKIICDDPDEDSLKKLFQISRLLNANLRGEEGEIYSQNENGDIISEE